MGSKGALRARALVKPADQRLLDIFLLAQGWLCVYKKGEESLKTHDISRLPQSLHLQPGQLAVLFALFSIFLCMHP